LHETLLDGNEKSDESYEGKDEESLDPSEARGGNMFSKNPAKFKEQISRIIKEIEPFIVEVVDKTIIKRNEKMMT